MYIDLLRGTVVEVSSFETTARRLQEADLYFWLDVMAVFDDAEDSEYYHVTLLEHATPTAFTTHLNPVYDDPTAITTTPSSPNPKSVPALSLLVNFVERALVETANHRGGAAFINPGRLRAGYYCAP